MNNIGTATIVRCHILIFGILVLFAGLLSACSDESNEQPRNEQSRVEFGQVQRGLPNLMNENMSKCYLDWLADVGDGRRSVFSRPHCQVAISPEIENAILEVIRRHGFACDYIGEVNVQLVSGNMGFYVWCSRYLYELDDYGGNIIVTPVR